VPKLEDAFASLSRVRTPDVWSDAREREPRAAPPAPSGPRRFAIAAAALAIFVAGFLFATSTFDRSGREPATSVTTSAPSPTPTPSGASPTPSAASPTPTPSLPGGAGPITPVVALPGTSTSIASGAGGVVFVSARTDGGDRVVLRWDPSTQDVLRSEPIPGTQIVDAGGALWAAGDDGGDPSGTPNAAAVYRIDPATLAVVRTVDLPSVPGVIGAAPDGSIWVGVDGQLLVLDAASGAIVNRFDVDGSPMLLAFDPSGAHAYVVTDAPAGRDGDLLLELDPSTGERIASSAVGVRELNGPSSLTATDAGVWVGFPTGMMGHASLLAEGTLREVDATLAADATSGSNGLTLSAAGGVVWLSDNGAVKCFDPGTGALRDAFETPTRNADLIGRRVVATAAGLLMDGSPYLLRLDPPAACGATG
jgi:outer membrane protein assembly factor BamB